MNRYRVHISERASYSKVFNAKNEKEAQEIASNNFYDCECSDRHGWEFVDREGVKVFDTEKVVCEETNRVDENLLEDIKKDLLETCEINKNINWDDQETAPSEECLLFIDNLNRYIPKYQNPNTEWQEIKKDIVSKLEDFSSSENPNVFFNDLGITIENLFSKPKDETWW